jgi:AcrR family transcriptional regulator
VYTKRKSTPRDAAATRAAILASARRAFAAKGYDGAGVREIAAGAGVTAMLVNRYFGSKEKLFAEVCAATMEAPVILAGANLAAPDRARAMAQALVGLTGTGDMPLEGFRIMLNSVSSKPAARIGRAQIEKRYQRLLADALKGPHPEERAGLVFALVAGVQAMRQMMGLKALAEADPNVLVKLLTPLFEALL